MVFTMEVLELVCEDVVTNLDQLLVAQNNGTPLRKLIVKIDHEKKIVYRL